MATSVASRFAVGNVYRQINAIFNRIVADMINEQYRPVDMDNVKYSLYWLDEPDEMIKKYPVFEVTVFEDYETPSYYELSKAEVISRYESRQYSN